MCQTKKQVRTRPTSFCHLGVWTRTRLHKKVCSYRHALASFFSSGTTRSPSCATKSSSTLQLANIAACDCGGSYFAVQEHLRVIDVLPSSTRYTVYLVGSLPNIDPSATTPISSKAFATVAASSSSDPPAGSIPHSVHFPVETPFGTGRLAIPCTETSPSVGIHLDTGSASGHHVVCYCDRSRVRPVEQTVAAADSIAARARPASTRSPSHSEDELTTSDNARARSRSNSSSSSAAVSSIHESSSVPNFITYAWDHKIGQWVLSEGGEYLSPLGSVSRTARSSATVSPLASPVGPKAQARPRREDSYSSVVTESSSRPASSRGRGAAAGGGTASESDDNVSTATSREPSSSQKQQQQQQQQRHFKKSVVPTSEQIAQLPLKAGSNTLAFEVYSRLQGRSRIEATLFLWSPTAKVVISDVDGTITKSDVMGHVMFMIGRDWTHNGVAPLYAKIAENGYKFVYLTSRNIGQVDNTKMYLRNISQNQCKVGAWCVCQGTSLKI